MVRIASALSTLPTTTEAAREAAARVVAELGDEPPDLAAVFFSPQHNEAAETAASEVKGTLDPRTLIGCTGVSIVGDGREVEEGPALAVWAANLPGARIEGFHSQFVRTEQAAGFTGVPDLAERPDAHAVLMLADGFSYRADALLRYATDRFPGVPFVGGMASGGRTHGEHRLILDGHVHTDGAVGILLSGDVPMRTIVSQGCRPIGPSFVVTKAEDNMVGELAGEPALGQLKDVLENAEEADRSLASFGIHLGIAVDEYRDDFGRGDFLIRNVIGANEDEGTFAIGDVVEVGQTVRFHVRDADSADEDLLELLGGVAPPPVGGLLFTCNGRGRNLFIEPDHDVNAITKALGEMPLAGMFCQGEIGPVGPKSFLHGFTASAAFFG